MIYSRISLSPPNLLPAVSNINNKNLESLIFLFSNKSTVMFFWRQKSCIRYKLGRKLIKISELSMLTVKNSVTFTIPTWAIRLRFIACKLSNDILITHGFFFLGEYGPGIALIAASFTGCNPALTVAVLTIGVGLNGGIYSGFKVNHLDISPRFAGILMAFTNCLANLAGLLAPLTAGYVIKGKVRFYLKYSYI